MSKPETGGLRGFDSYRVSLGDEMRGERASMGKSLLDVQRELRIRAAHVDAIENANPDAIPYRGFVTGYVRAYARYLGMDEETVLRRFCEESNFAHPGAGAPAPSGRTSARSAAVRTAARDDLDAVIAGSRLAAASRASAINADLGATLRGLGSLGVMAALVGGLGYGGWAILENIQRVEFVPAAQEPDALATVPEFDMSRIARAGVGPAPTIDPAALAAVYAAQEAEPPKVALRDGPISALDPDSGGVYAGRARVATASVDLDPAFTAALGLDKGAEAAAPARAVAPNEAGEADAVGEAPAAPPPQQGVALVIDAEAWVRVRNGGGQVVHEALMPAGASWRAPQDAEGFTLRAGNAGGVFLEVDGALYGPLGRPGAVVSNVLLDKQAVRGALPEATQTAESDAIRDAIAVSAELADR